MRKCFTGTLPMVVVFLAIVSVSCEENVNIPEGAFQERARDISGNWAVTSVTRNGTAMTDRFDFSGFRLVITENENGGIQYTINNAAPFLVRSNGTITTDDPAYPFALTFQESGSSAGAVAELASPILSEHSPLILEFSTGCGANVYSYAFEKVEN
jgi:hypothetical protein